MKLQVCILDLGGVPKILETIFKSYQKTYWQSNEQTIRNKLATVKQSILLHMIGKHPEKHILPSVDLLVVIKLFTVLVERIPQKTPSPSDPAGHQHFQPFHQPARLKKEPCTPNFTQNTNSAPPKNLKTSSHTVEGSEILRSPVEVGSLSTLFTGFLTF